MFWTHSAAIRYVSTPQKPVQNVLQEGLNVLQIAANEGSREVIKELIEADFARVSVDKVMDYTFESLCKNPTWSPTVLHFTVPETVTRLLHETEVKVLLAKLAYLFFGV